MNLKNHQVQVVLIVIVQEVEGEQEQNHHHQGEKKMLNPYLSLEKATTIIHF